MGERLGKGFSILGYSPRRGIIRDTEQDAVTRFVVTPDEGAELEQQRRRGSHLQRKSKRKQATSRRRFFPVFRSQFPAMVPSPFLARQVRENLAKDKTSVAKQILFQQTPDVGTRPTSTSKQPNIRAKPLYRRSSKGVPQQPPPHKAHPLVHPRAAVPVKPSRRSGFSYGHTRREKNHGRERLLVNKAKRDLENDKEQNGGHRKQEHRMQRNWFSAIRDRRHTDEHRISRPSPFSFKTLYSKGRRMTEPAHLKYKPTGYRSLEDAVLGGSPSLKASTQTPKIHQNNVYGHGKESALREISAHDLSPETTPFIERQGPDDSNLNLSSSSTTSSLFEHVEFVYQNYNCVESRRFHQRSGSEQQRKMQTELERDQSPRQKLDEFPTDSYSSASRSGQQLESIQLYEWNNNQSPLAMVQESPLENLADFQDQDLEEGHDGAVNFQVQNGTQVTTWRDDSNAHFHYEDNVANTAVQVSSADYKPFPDFIPATDDLCSPNPNTVAKEYGKYVKDIAQKLNLNTSSGGEELDGSTNSQERNSAEGSTQSLFSKRNMGSFHEDIDDHVLVQPTGSSTNLLVEPAETNYIRDSNDSQITESPDSVPTSQNRSFELGLRLARRNGEYHSGQEDFGRPSVAKNHRHSASAPPHLTERDTTAFPQLGNPDVDEIDNEQTLMFGVDLAHRRTTTEPLYSGPTVNPDRFGRRRSKPSRSSTTSTSTATTPPRTPLLSVISGFSKLFKEPKTLSPPKISSAQADATVISEMDSKLGVRTEAKTKAVEDARKMQAYVVEECKKSGKDPPPYGLEELIGKGSFGRVYKGKDMTTAKVVAIKIIDIDESDTLNPKNSDAYSEFLKEVNALKLLGENKAKNINLIMEALPVGKAMWMITEYCGGGSVATLMKPTLPKGLLEKWVRVILREVAEGLFWVHQVGIIHRDIKCGNVLVTENGEVQICDFGVAGIIETKTDKRSTIIGTPHWMAPELLNENNRALNYGTEVDIWAFGAMAYEMASGLPPAAREGIQYPQLQAYLKKNMPRLPAKEYSEELRDLVETCLQENPQVRPTIEELQKHRYIYNTSNTFPTSNLRALVLAFRKWETDGGSRKSLFWQHGAQAPSAIVSPTDDEDWNFSVTDDFDDKLQSDFQSFTNAYKFPNDDASNTARPMPQQQQARPSRRRPPPEALGRGLSVGPLEKLFDPNTLTSYNDNIAARYGKQSDLPLRDDSAEPSIRDTMIDLGGHDIDMGVATFSDMDTIRANRRNQDESADSISAMHDFSRPALSDPADINLNRRTQDWKFPSAAAPPASADPEISRFPISYEVPRPSVTPGSGGRPTLIHHPTEPVGAFGGGLNAAGSSMGRESLIDLDMGQRLSIRESLIDLDLDPGPVSRMSTRESLIDLDMGMPIPEFRRPGTGNSDVSATSEQVTANPFELERHASLYQPMSNGREPSIYVSDDREPSMYISDDSMSVQPLRNGNVLKDLGEMSDFSSASDAEGYANDRYMPSSIYPEESNGYYADRQPRPRTQDYEDLDRERMPPPLQMQPHPVRTSSRMAMPPISDPPSARISTGIAPRAEVEADMMRSIRELSNQMAAFRDIYGSAEVLQRRGSGVRRERRDPGLPPQA